jgi:hypothetical protein
MGAGRVAERTGGKARTDQTAGLVRRLALRREKPRTRTSSRTIRARDNPLRGEMQQRDDNGVTLLVPSARMGSMEQRSLWRS